MSQIHQPRLQPITNDSTSTRAHATISGFTVENVRIVSQKCDNVELVVFGTTPVALSILAHRAAKVGLSFAMHEILEMRSE